MAYAAVDCQDEAASTMTVYIVLSLLIEATSA